MPEIKSTLDLVMERTKNMVFSEEERKSQETETAKKHFNGTLQKHLDDLMPLKDLQKTLGDLQKKYPAMEPQTLRNVLLEKIDLEALQGPLPDLLHTLFGCRIEGLKQLGHLYAGQIQSKAQQHSARVRQGLEQQHQISGSAVIPNLEADPQWIRELQKIEAVYAQRLEENKSAI